MINYCSNCAFKVEHKIPDGDTKTRAYCPQCNLVHYENPKIVGGTIPIYEDKVLLCKRAIEPRYGFWTLPAGFMELDETTADCALRETWEEAQAKVTLGPIFTVFDVLRANQVHIFYLAKLKEPIFCAGPESIDVKLFDLDSIPWDELAFKTVTNTLKLYKKGLETNFFGIHTGNVDEFQSWSQNDFIPK